MSKSPEQIDMWARSITTIVSLKLYYTWVISNKQIMCSLKVRFNFIFPPYAEEWHKASPFEVCMIVKIMPYLIITSYCPKSVSWPSSALESNAIDCVKNTPASKRFNQTIAWQRQGIFFLGAIGLWHRACAILPPNHDAASNITATEAWMASLASGRRDGNLNGQMAWELNNEFRWIVYLNHPRKSTFPPQHPKWHTHLVHS